MEKNILKKKRQKSKISIFQIKNMIPIHWNQFLGRNQIDSLNKPNWSYYYICNVVRTLLEVISSHIKGWSTCILWEWVTYILWEWVTPSRERRLSKDYPLGRINLIIFHIESKSKVCEPTILIHAYD